MSQIRQFDWVPEEELKKKSKRAYFADGEASFCIEGIEDGFTADAKPKTMFKLSIIDKNGRTGTYTVHALKSAAWMFMNIFNAVGRGIYRQGGYCDNDILHKNGKLIFGTKESEKYGVNNEILEWLPYKGNDEPNPFKSGMKTEQEIEAASFDDDIPF